jgi:2-oxoglutarate ferredoxin oxidoreductase subunit beta
MIDLVAGEPMVYGKERDKGLKMVGFDVKRVPAAEADVWQPDVRSPGPAFVLAQLDGDPEMPRPMGLLRSVQAPVFDAGMNAQIEQAIKAKGKGTLKSLIYSGDMWTV